MTESLTQSNPENYPSPQHSPEDAINLIDVLGILVRKKFLIFSNIFIFSLASIFHVQTTTPIYQTEIAFLKPSKSFIPKSFLGTNSKNAEKTLEPAFYTETDQSLYFKFLTRIQSYQHQQKVFEEGGFLKKFSGIADNSDSPEDYFLRIHKSISLTKESKIKKKKDEIMGFEKPIYLSMIGEKPAAMSEFLNAISKTAKENIQSDTLDLVKMKIEEAVQDNNQKKKIFTLMAQLGKKETQSRIEQENLERLRVLTDSLTLAKNLKIKNNNFSVPDQNWALQMAEIFDPELKSRKQKIPIWFLYGELALEKEIEILKSKVNDIDYIDNRVNLEYKYEQLETSKRLPDKYGYFQIERYNILTIEDQLNKLKIAKMKLEAMDISSIKANLVVISQPSITPSIPIEPNKIKVVLIGTCFGLFIGLLAAFFSHAIGALRKHEEDSTSV
jgi:LPS O-antigen subunit length determinant protein (WzzB/FepE family)